MLFFFRTIFFTLMLVAKGAFADSETAILPEAVFTDNFIDISKTTENPRVHRLGLVTQNNEGWGVSYHREFAKDRRWRTELIYGPRRYIFLKPYEATPEVANATIFKTRSWRILAGFDQVVHITQNKYWGLVIGINLGMDQNEYEATFYGQRCYLWCGFDPNSYTTQYFTDSYTFLSGRLGVTWLKTTVWNLQGDFQVSIQPLMARTGSLEFRSPDGRQFFEIDRGLLEIEAVFEF